MIESGLKHIGDNQAIQRAIELAKKLALNDMNACIEGERGSGKEWLAKFIHNNSKRSQMPFVSFSCRDLSSESIEEELMGKEGAPGEARTRGLLEKAHGGTLFISNLFQLPEHCQEILIRVMDNKELNPPGSSEIIHLDVRIIGAADKHLEEYVEVGALREDLYYRLRAAALRMPPLRRRKKDIPLIVNHFIDHLNERRHEHKSIKPETMEALCNYHWPHNIRELKSALSHAYEKSASYEISVECLPHHIRDDDNGMVCLDDIHDIRELEKMLLLRVLRKTNFNPKEAASRLGMGLSTLYRKMKTYNIHKPH